MKLERSYSWFKMRVASAYTVLFSILIWPFHLAREVNMNYTLSILSEKKDLCRFIGITKNDFDKVIQNHKVFNKQVINKKNGKGERIVWNPLEFNRIYKSLAKRLNNTFQNYLTGFPHKSSFGFINSKNTRDNAFPHCGASFILKTDIEKFFPSITESRITKLFKSVGACTKIARLLAKFVTINGILPEGLPTSPVISNAICHNMDRDLEKIAKKNQSDYTRYVDDITFSTETYPIFLQQIELILQKNDFKISTDKTRITKRGQANFVTGLSVTDPHQPHVPKKIKRKIRQILYYITKFGLIEHLQKIGLDSFSSQGYINHLDGYIKYISYIEPKVGPKLKASWHKILTNSGREVSYATNNKLPSKKCHFLIDEAEIEFKGKKYLALCICTTEDAKKIRQNIQKTLNDFLSDSWADGKRAEIEKNGLHYCDATQDLKLDFIKRLQTSNFQCFLAFGHYNKSTDYEDTYIKLFEVLLKRRLIASDNKKVTVAIEINNKVSETKLRNFIDDTYEKLSVSNNKKPIKLKTKFVDKKYNLIALPDFMLGVFGQYIKKAKSTGLNNTPNPRETLFYERLSAKYNVIKDYDNNKEYSTRRPFKKL